MPNNPRPITDHESSAPHCYLVTGAAGFIASKVCEQLLAAGHTVVGVDNLNDYYDIRMKDWRLLGLLGRSYSLLGEDPKVSVFTNNKEPITNSSGTFIFHHLDIENLPALEALFTQHKFTAVFNLAARAGVRASMANPYVFLSTNTEGALNLLECQRKYGVKKQVLASTSSLYAGCPMPFTEDQPVNTPLSPYAAAKKGAELMAYSYHKLYGLDISVLRYFTVFGPAGRPDMAPLRFIKWIDEGKPLELFGDGSQSRDFTYVDDIARGTILAAKALGYEIINLGGGRNPISLNTVIGYIEKALTENRRNAEAGNSSPPPSALRPPPSVKAIIAQKPFHVADLKETWADITKAGRLLGWKPTVMAEEGFQRTVAWYAANRSWLKDVHL